MEQGPDVRLPLPLLLTLLLTACASTGPAPVEDRSGMPVRAPRAAAPASNRSGAHSHHVERGDTLYSIAFRNGLDYRDLATWNRIAPPYTIYVGQVLRLAAPAAATTLRHAAPTAPGAPGAEVARVTGVAAAPAPARPQPAPFEAPQATPAAPPAEATPTIAATPPATAGVAAAPAPSASAPSAPAPSAPAPSTPAPSTPAPSTPAAAATATVGEVSWRWPAGGVLVGSFVAGDPTRQGIDLAGKAGDPVRAAAAGSVVYSGNGLVGYGELIIIKHNASFLSAYGHNRKRMVREGEQVQAGQVIAEMGSSSASRDSLHFEIRRNGKPVNPLDYLPRR